MKKTLLLFCCFTLLFACTKKQADDGAALVNKLTGSNFGLTDEMVMKYIATYKALRAKGPELLQVVNESKGNDDSGKKGYADIESAIKANGFASYAEFIKVNAKVAWAFSLAQGTLFSEGMEGQVNSGLQQINETLKDPNVPEEAKAELRKAKETIEKEWAKNKGWSDLVLNRVKSLTSDADMDVISRHRKELEEVFSGVTLVQPTE